MRQLEALQKLEILLKRALNGPSKAHYICGAIPTAADWKLFNLLKDLLNSNYGKGIRLNGWITLMFQRKVDQSLRSFVNKSICFGEFLSKPLFNDEQKKRFISTDKYNEFARNCRNPDESTKEKSAAARLLLQQAFLESTNITKGNRIGLCSHCKTIFQGYQFGDLEGGIFFCENCFSKKHICFPGDPSNEREAFANGELLKRYGYCKYCKQRSEGRENIDDVFWCNHCWSKQTPSENTRYCKRVV